MITLSGINSSRSQVQFAKPAAMIVKKVNLAIRMWRARLTSGRVGWKEYRKRKGFWIKLP
jgi:hypothetical protein